jgi:hypothetical protein
MTEDNSHAGQGAVMLDIGGDIGALVVIMPEQLRGQEIEIRPVGFGGDQYVHHHDHPHGHGHSHDGHTPDATPHLPHVAVVPRPLGERFVDSAVFGDLREGSYELYVRPDGPVQLRADIRGGEVTQARWPDSD